MPQARETFEFYCQRRRHRLTIVLQPGQDTMNHKVVGFAVAELDSSASQCEAELLGWGGTGGNTAQSEARVERLLLTVL